MDASDVDFWIAHWINCPPRRLNLPVIRTFPGGMAGARSTCTNLLRDGVTLTGHIQGGEGNTIHLAGDLKENLAKADKVETDLVKMVDDYITRKGLDIPAEILPVLRDGYDAPEITELDLQASGITTIIWAMGYRFDFSLVKLPVRDTDGFPIQKRGVTAFPGLYFVGLPWTDKMSSGLLLGVGESAEHIASQIAARPM